MEAEARHARFPPLPLISDSLCRSILSQILAHALAMTRRLHIKIGSDNAPYAELGIRPMRGVKSTTSMSKRNRPRRRMRSK